MKHTFLVQIFYQIDFKFLLYAPSKTEVELESSPEFHRMVSKTEQNVNFLATPVRGSKHCNLQSSVINSIIHYVAMHFNS